MKAGGGGGGSGPPSLWKITSYIGYIGSIVANGPPENAGSPSQNLANLKFSGQKFLDLRMRRRAGDSISH